MPYAGFFIEKLKRDQSIYENNKKNSIDDYLDFCKLNKIDLLNVLKKDFYQFDGKKLIKKDNVNIEKTNS